MERRLPGARGYHALMSGFVRDGRGLHYTELAEILGLTPDEALQAQRGLTQSGLPIWAHPDTDHLAAMSPSPACPPSTASPWTASRSGTPSEDVGADRSWLGPASVGRDDLLDAASCLLTAYRIWRGHALVLPPGPVPLDARGLRMEIVA